MVELVERWSCHRRQTPGGGSNPCWSTDKPQINQYDLTARPAERQRVRTRKKHRARQDPHPSSTHEHTGHSVLSYDFGYCSRLFSEEDKQTCLVLYDRDTKLILTIPTPQKGGKYLQYLVTEFVRFIMHTQQKEIALRSDLEPTNLAIADGVRKFPKLSIPSAEVAWSLIILCAVGHFCMDVGFTTGMWYNVESLRLSCLLIDSTQVVCACLVRQHWAIRRPAERQLQDGSKASWLGKTLANDTHTYWRVSLVSL